MSKVQVIEKNGKPEFYVLPAAMWERVRELVEDTEDVAAFDRAIAVDDGTRIPMQIVRAELSGTHPVRAWREYRNITQDALALAAGVSKPFVSQIEGGKRAGSTATLKKLAKALKVPMDLLAGP